MSVDLQVDQALILKKRARRRLVGAVALVLLMIIILPQILQDRSALTKPEPIKITMPEVKHEQTSEPNEPQVPVQPVINQSVTEPQNAAETELIDTPNVENIAAIKEAEAKELERRKSLAKAAEIKPEPVAAVKPEIKKPEPLKVAKPVEKVAAETNMVSPKAVEEKSAPKSTSNFTVQVGVYSDAANVKRLQEQLKQAGFATTTEKATTPKGEALRLKAGKFTSRQDAMNALVKIKEIGLSGIVISND
ncbi:SPOR domain-containing protein [Methylotenera sp.]|uniref:SPOR domain-containing protein n=1 Tax=Methylotenera sp. TaxID=2051956 RepID=UPI002ED86920